MFVCNVCMQCMYGMHVRNVCMHVCMQWFAMQCYVMAMSMSVSVSFSVSLSVSMSCHVMYVCIYIYIYLYLDTRYICTRPCHPPPRMGWVPFTGPIWDLPPPPPVVWWGCGTVPLPPLWCGGGVVWYVGYVWCVWSVWYGMSGWYCMDGRYGM